MPKAATPSHPPLCAELETAFRQQRQFLWRLARQQLRDDAAAEDVVQETFTAAWLGYAQFAQRSSLRTWLVGILRYKILDALRLRMRQEIPMSAFQQELDDLNPDGLFDEQDRWLEMPQPWGEQPQSPDERHEHHELLRTLQTCLINMPDHASQIFLMREYLGFQAAEIATRTGLQAGNIRIMVMRVRLALRSCIELRQTRGTKP